MTIQKKPNASGTSGELTVRGMLLASRPAARRLHSAGLINQEALKAVQVQFRPQVDENGETVDSFFYLWHKTLEGVLLPKFHHSWAGYDSLDKWLSAAMSAGVSLRHPNEHIAQEWDFRFTLYEAQEDAVQQVTAALHRETGCILNAKCGSGKTIMAMAVVARMRAGRVVVLVDQVDIAKQWQTRISDTIPDMPVQIVRGSRTALDASFAEPGVLIVVAQTLMRTSERLERPIQCDLLIVDEVHVFAAPSFYASMGQIDFRWSLGLSATLERRDGLQWVFKAILGTTVIEAKTQSLLARVKQVRVPVDLPSKAEFGVSFCRRIRKQTSFAYCRTMCPHFAKFPKKCGGGLPLDTTGNVVVWKDPDLMHTLQYLSKHDEYNAWLTSIVVGLANKNRQVLVLSKYVNHLVALALAASKTLGEERCGLFIGKQRSGVKQHEREEALTRQVTFATYGVAEKALDIPHKDALVLALPVSDVRQAKGRIERFVPGKPQPIVIDPIINKPAHLIGGARKRRRFYEMTGSTVEVV